MEYIDNALAWPHGIHKVSISYAHIRISPDVVLHPGSFGLLFYEF